MSLPMQSAQIDVPEELHGQRVLLRPYRLEDAEAVFAAIDESRDHLRPWVGWTDSYTTLEQTRVYCVRCAQNWLARSDLAVGIFDGESGDYLGGGGLHQPDWTLRTFEVSCWLRASTAYRGYGAEALRLLADLAFISLEGRQINLISDARNEATKRLAEKCGYVFRGSVRNGYVAPDGKLVDKLVYSLTPEDWLPARLDPPIQASTVKAGESKPQHSGRGIGKRLQRWVKGA